MLMATAVSASLTGCTAILSPIDSIPAERLPAQFLAEPQADKVPIDVSRLRQPTQQFYLLDEGDTLGVFVEGVLGNFDEAPPVQFPEMGSDLAPSIGFPVPVREDGTISLPLVDSIAVRGLNIQQVEQLISRAYREGDRPLLKDDGRIIVTLMRKRTYRVFVVRQDNTFFGSNAQFAAQRGTRAVTDRSDQSSRGFVLQLPAGENDVLNALSQTGGMPGVNAKNEIRVLRGDRIQVASRTNEIEEFYRSNNASEFPYGELPAIKDDAATVRIPLRHNPGEIPKFRPEDIILQDGDIVYVDSRETDVYYTGGLLVGGEWPLPRDYDLDVLGAIALSGSSVGVGRQNSGGFVGGLQGVPASELIILRSLPGRQQIAIRVDINKSINDPRARLLVKAGDTLILRYKPQEEVSNFALVTFFTYGLRSLFR